MKLPFEIKIIKYDDIYDNLFVPQDTGWQGGDAAHSIKLNDNRVLWLFGDTFIGKNDYGQRKVLFPHINNSLAITKKINESNIDLKFYWKNKDGSPSSFFPSLNKTPDIYYWPTNGLLIKENLIILCFSIQGNFDGKYLDFWSTVGTNMIIVSNPKDDPNDWETEYVELGIGNNQFGIHSGLYFDDPYIYFLGYKKDAPNGNHAILARAIFSKLIQNKSSDSIEYFCENGGELIWTQSNKNMKKLFIPGNTESSIIYLNKRKIFLCTTYDPLESKLYLLVAKKITGPWHGPFEIFQNPDHISMTYAFRIHSALMDDEDSLVCSYITSPNSDMRKEYIDPKFYRPRFIRMGIR